MPTLVTVFPAVLKAQKRKKSVKFDKFHKIPRGGSGPKHSAFCGACFSINPYRVTFWSFSINLGLKNHEPSTFLVRHFFAIKLVFGSFFNLSLPRFFNLIFFSRQYKIYFHPYHFKNLILC
jgi:hypothetical protein